MNTLNNMMYNYRYFKYFNFFKLTHVYINKSYKYLIDTINMKFIQIENMQ